MPTLERPELFEPTRLGSLTLPHRVVMAPMTRNRADAGGLPNELMAEYYAQRASAALILTEGAQVSRQGVGYPNTPGIHDREQVRAWRRVTDAVHEVNGRIFLQLWHVGRISHPSFHGGALPVAPSQVAAEGEGWTVDGTRAPFPTPRALQVGEIPAVVGQFRDGAVRALEAGFDGVEVHGANGYLIDQFLRDGTNRRDDVYGGSVRERARFALEVVQAVAGVWGPERVGIRLSPLSSYNDMYDSDPESTFTYTAERIGELGLAYLHLARQNDFEGRPESFDLGRIRRAYGGPIILNGGFDGDDAARAVSRGEAELVSFGRPFLANPDLPRRLRVGAPLNEPDASTFYGGGAEGYVDYPVLGQAAA